MNPTFKTKVKPALDSEGYPKPDIIGCYYLDKANNNAEVYYSFVFAAVI
jgi:hypothetical protein